MPGFSSGIEIGIAEFNLTCRDSIDRRTITRRRILNALINMSCACGVGALNDNGFNGPILGTKR